MANGRRSNRSRLRPWPRYEHGTSGGQIFGIVVTEPLVHRNAFQRGEVFTGDWSAPLFYHLPATGLKQALIV